MKKIFDKIFLNLCPIIYLGLTRAQDSHDRFLFGSEIVKNNSTSQTIKVLDVGCGGGNFYTYLKSNFSNVEYLGLDFDVQKINSQKYNEKNFKIISQDLREEWFFDEFDFVWSSEVIEHILNDQFFFQNLIKSAKKEGYIILTTPHTDSYINFANKFGWSKDPSKTEDGGHVRLGYTEEDLKKLANKYNLDLVDIYFISECDDYRAKNLGKINNGIKCYIFNILYYLKIFNYKRYQTKNNIKDILNYYSIAAVFKKK